MQGTNFPSVTPSSPDQTTSNKSNNTSLYTLHTRVNVHVHKPYKLVWGIRLLKFFSPQSPDQRNVDIETARAMMKLLLIGTWHLIEPFLGFLEVS